MKLGVRGIHRVDRLSTHCDLDDSDHNDMNRAEYRKLCCAAPIDVSSPEIRSTQSPQCALSARLRVPPLLPIHEQALATTFAQAGRRGSKPSRQQLRQHGGGIHRGR
jgi:hypothetical protein